MASENFTEVTHESLDIVQGIIERGFGPVDLQSASLRETYDRFLDAIALMRLEIDGND
jgi:hypothetical protein